MFAKTYRSPLGPVILVVLVVPVSLITVELDGIPLIIVGRSGENIGRTEIQVWERVVAAPIGRSAARTERVHWLLLVILSCLLICENILIQDYDDYDDSTFSHFGVESKRRQRKTQAYYRRRLANDDGQTHDGRQFIDLEAQLDSSDEDCSDDEGEVRQTNETSINDYNDAREVPSLSAINVRVPNRRSDLDHLAERIEEQYIDHGGVDRHSSQVQPHHDIVERAWLSRCETDWLLWRVKCTPGQEYFIIFELMMRHVTLSDELRSAFYNPRDIGYVYLEAKFTKSGISSLQEVLREFSDLRLFSLALVPEIDHERCLTIVGDLKQVFAPGQWVSIKRGLYRGDVGLVVDDYREQDSTTGVKVMVVPRLDYADTPSAVFSKRKRRFRPSARLFNPAECVQENLIAHRRQHVFSYRSWHFEYGLLLKTYHESSLTPACEVSSPTVVLFQEAKAWGANIELDSRPHSLFWQFEPGDQVFCSENGSHGTMISAFNPNTPSRLSRLEVEFEEGVRVVAVTSLTKDVILGQYVEVLAGVHSGKEGFVVAKADAFLYHRSVGTVKDVEVTSSRTPAITVRLDNGDERTVGYHAIRELTSGSLLLDYQPLKHHQQQFNVEVPWKEVKVTILSGRFVGHFAVVKNAWFDHQKTLRLSLWVSAYNCSIEIDHSAVHEQLTGVPLHVYRPLEGNQLTEFGISPLMESMRSGPIPWLGLDVDIVQGHFKGQRGVVRDVNRYKVNPSLKSKSSGLRVTVERQSFTAIASTKLVEVDYDAVRFHNTKRRLCEVFMPTAKQSFYWPDPTYQKNYQNNLTSSGFIIDADKGSKTPLPADFERETIFRGPWSPSCSTPGPSPSIPSDSSQTPAPVYNLESPVPWTPASPDPRQPSRSPTPAPAPSFLPDHWILHPKLVGIPIKVDINSGELKTLNKKDGIVVETVTGADGIKVVHRRSSKTTDVPCNVIESFRGRPNPAREKGLMIVARNHPEHIGKLVRRIHHFYNMEKNDENHWLIVQRVDRSGSKESTVFEFLEFHPNDLEYVNETPEERKWSTSLLDSTRLDFSYSGIDVRRPT
ncbi:hypothetical protein BDP27DRAFT_1367314 [Rhodocollybia butyracea]|uniref:Chromatin elongation factor SPT5 n=1 Tax=Rhodocollybia butyracea TaxID=206335 RepID=A0A9P5PFD7_9AGAR|nr:hypothetical protein BDP27DRAFT_1367314 [Rhodocollybia butyracea]